MPVRLSRLLWDLAKDELGQKGSDFLGLMVSLLVRSANRQFRAYLLDPTMVPSTLPMLVGIGHLPSAPSRPGLLVGTRPHPLQWPDK